jgi:hypothetical protein
LIENNRIENCGYGILCYQFDADPTIRGNEIVDNNIHPDTLNWGFGIACNGQNRPLIVENWIWGHWYGVALINGAQPNLGDLTNDDPSDDGGNQFLGNGLDGEMYELYNNTSGNIFAQGNWWGTADPIEVEDRIVHQPDNPSLGLVTYEPFLLSSAVGDDVAMAPSSLVFPPVAPNPFNPATTIRFETSHQGPVSVRVYDLAGRLVRILAAGTALAAGRHELGFDGQDETGRPIGSGVYLCRIEAGGTVATRSLVLVE